MPHAVLVTGANRGIGLELAKQYSEAGWVVHACCRDPEQAEELKAVSSRHKGLLHIHQLDMKDFKRIEGLAGQLKGSPLDILFNNAGTNEPAVQSFGRVDESAWLDAFKVNTIAPFKMAEAFFDNVSKGRRKIIASMSSIMGSIASSTGGYYVYRSTKAALNMAMKTLSMDLRSAGIKVVCIHPGWVKTRMGGPYATISTEESVSGIMALLDGLRAEDSGKFITYEGKEIMW